MSKASSTAGAGVEPWIERWQHRIAVFVSALLHLLLFLFAMLPPPVTVTPPQGTAGGSRIAVDFVGATPPTPTKTPPTKIAPPSKPAAKAPAASRVQSTLVAQSDDPLPADETTTADSLAAARVPDPVQVPEVPTPAPAASPPPTPQRRPRTWGQPPGMLQENVATENAGQARSPALDRGRRNDASLSAPSLEVDGYQVYYDLRSEIRMRAWRDQGMTEIFMPLPGTRRYMVCPLETALRRGSGPCRLLEPDSPELENIGDAREVINMQQVHRRGEAVWRGPGPYR